MDKVHTPWHARAVKAFHLGAFAATEKFLTKAPAGATRDALAYRDLILLDVLYALGRADDARALCERLAWEPLLDAEPMMAAKVQRYAKYFLHTWSPRVLTLRPVAFMPAHERLVGASVCARPDGLLVVARSLNVQADDKGGVRVAGDAWDRAVNTLHAFVLDPTLRTLEYTPLADRARIPRAHDHFIGYEDPRVFAWRDAMWLTATSYQLYASGKPHAVLCRADVGAGAVASAVALQCPDMNDDQKHWLPWVHRDTVHFVYRCSPWTILRLDDATTGATSVVATRALPWPQHGRVVPAAGPVPWRGGYLAVVAFHPAPDSAHRTHRFVEIGADLLPRRISSSWSLWKPEHEAVQGLAAVGDTLVLTAGHDQAEARVTRFAGALLDRFLSWYDITDSK